jgi:DNA-directed RNA polymerase subunit K/omega
MTDFEDEPEVYDSDVDSDVDTDVTEEETEEDLPEDIDEDIPIPEDYDDELGSAVDESVSGGKHDRRVGGGGGGESDDDDDTVMSDDSEEKILPLLQSENINEYILNSHPECLPITNEEMMCMLPVVRNSHGIIVDDFHKTLPVLTKYERTRVLGQRAIMIENGARVFVDVPPNIIDSAIIAQMELDAKKIPFIIKRPLPNHGFEYWRLADLEIL